MLSGVEMDRFFFFEISIKCLNQVLSFLEVKNFPGLLSFPSGHSRLTRLSV